MAPNFPDDKTLMERGGGDGWRDDSCKPMPIRARYSPGQRLDVCWGPESPSRTPPV